MLGIAMVQERLRDDGARAQKAQAAHPGRAAPHARAATFFRAGWLRFLITADDIAMQGVIDSRSVSAALQDVQPASFFCNRWRASLRTNLWRIGCAARRDASHQPLPPPSPPPPSPPFAPSHDVLPSPSRSQIGGATTTAHSGLPACHRRRSRCQYRRRRRLRATVAAPSLRIRATAAAPSLRIRSPPYCAHGRARRRRRAMRV